MVVFNDVVLRCQRTGTTSLPLVSSTNSRTNSLPDMQGKSKYATASGRHTRPRNLYKFIKVRVRACFAYFYLAASLPQLKRNSLVTQISLSATRRTTIRKRRLCIDLNHTGTDMVYQFTFRFDNHPFTRTINVPRLISVRSRGPSLDFTRCCPHRLARRETTKTGIQTSARSSRQ